MRRVTSNGFETHPGASYVELHRLLVEAAVLLHRAQDLAAAVEGGRVRPTLPEPRHGLARRPTAAAQRAPADVLDALAAGLERDSAPALRGPVERTEEVRAVVEQGMVEGMAEFVPSVPIVVEAAVRTSWAGRDVVPQGKAVGESRPEMNQGAGAFRGAEGEQQ